MMKTILLVAIGGGIGSALRYLTSLFVTKYFPNQFPIATFISNFLGCFLIGLFTGWLLRNQIHDSQLKPLLITGFCGGYTTFSAFSYENLVLFQNNNSTLAFINIGLSVLVGIFAVWFGLYLTR